MKDEKPKSLLEKVDNWLEDRIWSANAANGLVSSRSTGPVSIPRPAPRPDDLSDLDQGIEVIVLHKGKWHRIDEFIFENKEAAQTWYEANFFNCEKVYYTPIYFPPGELRTSAGFYSETQTDWLYKGIQ